MDLADIQKRLENQPKAVEQLNQFAKLLNWKVTPFWLHMLHMKHDVVAMFTGNRYGKTAGVGVDYVLRILNIHPIPKKNMVYWECPNSVNEEDESPASTKGMKHKWLGHRLSDASVIPYTRQGLYIMPPFSPGSIYWNLLLGKFPLPGAVMYPEDGKCRVCGEKLRIHSRKNKIMRFCSETLPAEKETTGLTALEGESIEVRNVTYPTLKEWLPRFMIKRDITARRSSVTIIDPFSGSPVIEDKGYKPRDIVIEFVSYKQDDQATAGQERISCWCDEEPPFSFYEEQKGRLVDADGDLMFTLTPANHMSWGFDEVFERANLYLRTPAICDFYESRGEGKSQVEVTDLDTDQQIAVLQAASDDNPTLKKWVLDKKFDWDDPDTVATRRYGVFRQATGRIFGDMSYKIHLIDPNVYFPQEMRDQIFQSYNIARSADYHERTPWAIVWVAVSPDDEAFVIREWNPSPEKWVNVMIAREVAMRSESEKYVCNLIDPLARKIQTNTGISAIEDINRAFHELKRNGIGTGGYWEPFDTKGSRGRDAIKERLKNSRLVGKPFSNLAKRDGREIRLPTLWVFNTCRETAKSLKQWRYEEWTNQRLLVSKDRKETPSQRWSHFCTALEGVFKDSRFRPKRQGRRVPSRKDSYFRRAA